MSCTRVFDYFFENPVPSDIFTHRKEKKLMRIPWSGTLSLFYETFKSWVACAVTKKKEEIRKNQRILNLYRSLYSFTYYFYSTVFWIQNQRNQKLWSNSDTMKIHASGRKGIVFCSGISYIRVSVGIKIEALSVK